MLLYHGNPSRSVHQLRAAEIRGAHLGAGGGALVSLTYPYVLPVTQTERKSHRLARGPFTRATWVLAWRGY
eukprot:79463-Prymnesium_polylepis.1